MFSLPAPFTSSWHITPALIDHYGHVNNVAYVKQIETVAWLHSNSLGLSIEQYKALDRGMAIRTHHLEYHHPLHLDDTVTCATWITLCDGKASLHRRFEMVNINTGKCVFSAQTQFICIALSTGKIKRMPPVFTEAYSKAYRQVKDHV